MSNTEASPTDIRAATLNRRDRTVILLALFGVTAIAWVYLLAMPQNAADMAMDTMPGMAMPAVPWTLVTVALTFAMWWVMMLGMMLPSAAPMILTFATLNRNKRARGQTFVPTSIFTLGYLIAWGVFSLVATLAQWMLDRIALLSPMASITSPIVGGVVLVLAGVYQFTPLKQACLRNCRSPFAFLLNRWRDGRFGKVPGDTVEFIPLPAGAIAAEQQKPPAEGDVL